MAAILSRPQYVNHALDVCVDSIQIPLFGYVRPQRYIFRCYDFSQNQPLTKRTPRYVPVIDCVKMQRQRIYCQ